MKDYKEPLLIILVIFVIMGLTYKPEDSKNNSKSINSRVNEENSQISSSANLSKEIKNIEQETKTLQKELGKRIEESKRSPYYDKIKMSRISGLGNSDPSKEYLSLTTSLKENEMVKITGWYLKSEITGYYVTIGRAALLPYPFKKTESDIFLQKGDKVYLTKGFSPIGISFRTNKCTGYFEENRTFYPSLSRKCPEPEDESLPLFSNNYDRNEECLELIERVPKCTTINNEYLRDLPDTVTESCKNYLKNNISYEDCVSLHFSDTDFPGNEYRVYLNKFGPLWREKSDKINLYDQNNLIVDTISWN